MSKIQNVVPFGQRHGASLSKKRRIQAAHQRSREPVTRSRMTVRGRFPSAKIGRMVDWESQLERRACYRFEFSPAVLSFKEQPEPIRFGMGDYLAKYTPDFELSLVNGETWFVEIKPADHLYRPEIAERLSLASECYKRNGDQFIVVTDLELIEPNLESNLAFLRHFQTHENTASTFQYARNWITQTDLPTLGGLNEYFNDKVTAYALLCQGLITTDFSEYFSPDSEVRLPEENSYANLLFSYRTAPSFELCTLYCAENS